MRKLLTVMALTGSALALTACQEGAFAGMGAKPEGAAQAAAGETIEKDVEAPEVFSANEDGLWDGRPSLGGVWVAHPSVKDPERVLIRNPANGQEVVGALFRRERDNPGPKLQVSSDAAEAIGMLAGAPTKLKVVALRREVIEAPAPEAAPLVDGPVVAKPEAIETASLDDTLKGAEGAIAAAETGKPATVKPAPKPPVKPDAKASATPAAPAPAATATPAAPPVAGTAPKAAAPKSPAAPAGKMYVQLGIFSIEGNAQGVEKQMAKAGLQSVVKKESSNGKTFWRVLAGPAASTTERDALLKKVKALGYADAYAVSK